MDYLHKANTDSLPPNFAPPEAWPEFGALMMPQAICRREWVGTNPIGVRWGAWPLMFEQYISDTEPNLTESQQGTLTYNRLVVWKRVALTDIPKGWHQAPTKKSWRIDGYHELMSGVPYIERWHKKARHDLRLWQTYVEQHEYAIEETSFAEFKKAYLKSTVYKTQDNFFINMLERKQSLPQTLEHLKLWVVRNTKSGTIVAGTAAHFSPTYQSSIRECPFILPEARECQAATGLMDKWFSECEARGIKILFFTYFWQPGEPKSWRGFSTFKSHFVTNYVSYPPVLWRIVRGKFL